MAWVWIGTVLEILIMFQDQDLFPMMSTKKITRFFTCAEIFGAIIIYSHETDLASVAAATGPSECHLWQVHDSHKPWDILWYIYIYICIYILCVCIDIYIYIVRHWHWSYLTSQLSQIDYHLANYSNIYLWKIIFFNGKTRYIQTGHNGSFST